MRCAVLFAVLSLCLCPHAFGQGQPGNGPPVLSPLTLTVTGNGSISPNLNNRLLRIGATYTITAIAGPGFIFSHWTGVEGADSSRLRFVMQSNLVLQAHFVPNPFLSLKGPYAGLLLEAGAMTYTNSGLFTASLTDHGRLTARLRLGGKDYALSGLFNAAGGFSNAIPRRGLTPLSVQLQLDFADREKMSGWVTDNSFTTAVTAYRATFSRTTNPAPAGGKRYTLVLGANEDSSLIPGGSGFGTVTVDLSGNIRFAGTLGEGSKCSQSSFVSKTDEWPLFAWLPSRRGSILGWLVFTNEALSDLRGRLSWFKVAQPHAKLYPAGFSLRVGLEAVGAQYSYSKGVPLLTLPTNGGVVVLEQGNLTQSLTNAFGLSTNNRVAGSNGLSLALNLGSGLFSGKLTDPASRSRLAIHGALLLKQNAGFGYFANVDQTGPVYVGPQADTAAPPPAISVVAPDGRASESGLDSGTFTVRRTGSTGSKLTVTYSLAGTAANGLDYATLSGRVIVPAASASTTVTVSPVDDDTPEDEETVVLTLSPDAGYVVESPDSATVAIADSEPPPPTVTVVATDESASESGPDPGAVTIRRTGSTDSALIVTYSIAGTAVNGVDYTKLSGSVTIPPASESATVTISPIDDAVVEGDESVVLTLTTGDAYRVGSPSSATVTLADNDTPPTGGTNLPSRVLNLTNWKLTLPVDTSHAGSPDEIRQPELAGFSDTNYFRVNDAGDGVVFVAPCGGATTSGSSYPRSELREMVSNGSANASWFTTFGTHTMEITQAITHLPVVKPHVVAGQIHDANDDVIVFRLEGTKLFIDQNGANGPTLTSNYRLGDVFTVKFVARNGGVECFYNGQYIYTYSVSASACYFKAGCYTQSNTSRGDAPTAYGEVVIYGLSIVHE
jgi:hypothetical protein